MPDAELEGRAGAPRQLLLCLDWPVHFRAFRDVGGRPPPSYGANGRRALPSGSRLAVLRTGQPPRTATLVSPGGDRVRRLAAPAVVGLGGRQHPKTRAFRVEFMNC